MPKEITEPFMDADLMNDPLLMQFFYGELQIPPIHHLEAQIASCVSCAMTIEDPVLKAEAFAEIANLAINLSQACLGYQGKTLPTYRLNTNPDRPSVLGVEVVHPDLIQ